jgi:hypothetical protein
MGEREMQGQCVWEREALAMRERETEGQCVTDIDVYTPLATDGSHEHQEHILYTYATGLRKAETGC